MALMVGTHWKQLIRQSNRALQQMYGIAGIVFVERTHQFEVLDLNVVYAFQLDFGQTMRVTFPDFERHYEAEVPLNEHYLSICSPGDSYTFRGTINDNQMSTRPLRPAFVRLWIRQVSGPNLYIDTLPVERGHNWGLTAKPGYLYIVALFIRNIANPLQQFRWINQVVGLECQIGAQFTQHLIHGFQYMITIEALTQPANAVPQIPVTIVHLRSLF